MTGMLWNWLLDINFLMGVFILHSVFFFDMPKDTHWTFCVFIKRICITEAREQKKKKNPAKLRFSPRPLLSPDHLI